MHAYLPPRVQLGQSGRESSGVEGSERPRSRTWLQHSADLQLENNDGWLGQHWWRGSGRTSTHSPGIYPPAWASMSLRNHQNTLFCWLQMCQDKPGWVLLWHPHVPQAFNPQHFTNNTNQNKSTSHFLWTPGLNGKLPLPCSTACKYGGKGWS